MKKPAYPLAAKTSKSHVSEKASRRTFVKTVAAGSAGLAIGLNQSSAMAMPASSYRRIAGANERISLGIIGLGQMARSHMRNIKRDHAERVNIAALCDVFQTNLDYASKQAPEAQRYSDYRRLIASPDVDAVVVTSPDHWHALHMINACEAGKDVYVEKPICVSIGEGQKMIRAAKRYNRVVQVGTQQRSNDIFAAAKTAIENGKIGQVSFVRAWNYGNNFPNGIGKPKDSSPPAGLDWDFWLGPAPKVPYNENRFGAIQDENYKYKRWATFRYFWDYAGGMMTDWGVHLLDIVLWAMNEKYPNSVNASGGTFLIDDYRDTPDTLSACFQFDRFMCTYENRTTNQGPRERMYRYGISFHGTEGTLFVNRGEMLITKESDEDEKQVSRTESSGNSHSKHMGNFLDCVVSREQPICDIETGHRSTAIAILGNLSYRTNQPIHWDGKKERISGNKAASKMLQPRYRKPWKI